MYRRGIRKAGNAGLVTMTAGNDLLHTLPTGTAPVSGKSVILTKILAYNTTGGNVTLQFGTLDRTVAGALFVALLPIFVAIDTLDNEWIESGIPAIEFISNTTVGANGRVGDVYVLASAAAVTVAIEVLEK